AALTEAGLRAAQRISHATGARLFTPSQVSRMARGRGRPRVDRIPYVVDRALEVLAGTKHVILPAAKAPTAFFAYPGKPSLVYPADATVRTLAKEEEDVVQALEAVADEFKGGNGDDAVVPPAKVIPGAATAAMTRDPISGPFDPVAFAHLFAPL